MKTTHFPHPPYHATKTELDNGLILITATVPTAIVEVGMHVHAGSLDDTIPGTASYLTHMIIESLEAKQRLAPLLARGVDVGCNFGRITSHFHLDGLENDLDDLIRGLAHIILRPSLSSASVEREKTAFDAALLSAPEKKPLPFYSWLRKRLFPDQPKLTESIHGTKESLQKISTQTLLRFHEQMYRPPNLCLTVMSRLPHDAILEKVSQLNIPPAVTPGPERVQLFEVPITTIETDDESLRMGLGVYVQKPMNRLDSLCLHMITTSLQTKEQLGTLWSDLRIGSDAAPEMQFHRNTKPTPFTSLYFPVHHRHVENVREVVLKEFEAIRNGDVDPYSLDTMKARIHKYHMSQEEYRSNRFWHALLMDILDWERDAITPEWDAYSAVANMRAEDLTAYANKALREEQIGIVMSVPKSVVAHLPTQASVTADDDVMAEFRSSFSEFYHGKETLASNDEALRFISLARIVSGCYALGPDDWVFEIRNTVVHRFYRPLTRISTHAAERASERLGKQGDQMKVDLTVEIRTGRELTGRERRAVRSLKPHQRAVQYGNGVYVLDGDEVITVLRADGHM